MVTGDASGGQETLLQGCNHGTFRHPVPFVAPEAGLPLRAPLAGNPDADRSQAGVAVFRTPVLVVVSGVARTPPVVAAQCTRRAGSWASRRARPRPDPTPFAPPIPRQTAVRRRSPSRAARPEAAAKVVERWPGKVAAQTEAAAARASRRRLPWWGHQRTPFRRGALIFVICSSRRLLLNSPPFAGHCALCPQRLQLHPLRPVLHNREVRLRLGVAELGDVDVVIGAGAVLLPGV